MAYASATSSTKRTTMPLTRTISSHQLLLQRDSERRRLVVFSFQKSFYSPASSVLPNTTRFARQHRRVLVLVMMQSVLGPCSVSSAEHFTRCWHATDDSTPFLSPGVQGLARRTQCRCAMAAGVRAGTRRSSCRRCRRAICAR